MSSRTRIFQVLECGGPGGTGNQVAALCNGLDPKRFQSHLVYAVRPGAKPKEYEALARGAAGFYHIPEMVRELRPFSDFKAWRRLFSLFRRERPDIVHAHSSKAGVLARTAAWAARVPRIYYSPHGYGFLQSNRSAGSRALYRSIESLMSRIGETIAVSQSEGTLSRELSGKARVKVIRDAYLGELPGEKEGNPSAILVAASGRMSFPRNPEAFVRLAARLARRSRRLRCLWIGAGELEPAVRRLRSSLLLEKTLELTGWLDHASALARLDHADVFVQFSRCEGLPIAVLEAMAHGLPVVASNIPPHRELIRSGENGLLAGDEAELERHVLNLARDPALRRRLGSAGQSSIREEFTKRRMLNEYEELYGASPP